MYPLIHNIFDGYKLKIFMFITKCLSYYALYLILYIEMINIKFC